MKSYKEFILENKSEKSKFIINKFNSYVKEDNLTDTNYLKRTYNKIYDKDVLVVAKNIYLSNTLNIKERRKIRLKRGTGRVELINTVTCGAEKLIRDSGN